MEKSIEIKLTPKELAEAYWSMYQEQLNDTVIKLDNAELSLIESNKELQERGCEYKFASQVVQDFVEKAYIDNPDLKYQGLENFMEYYCAHILQNPVTPPKHEVESE